MKIGIIGCGNMGEAILAQSVKRKAQNFIIFEKDKLKQAFVCRIYRVKAAKDIIDLVEKVNVVIIAVKPKDIDDVLSQILKGISKEIARRPLEKKKRLLLISIVAGISTAYIEKQTLGKTRVVRAMPNLAAKIGEGITALVAGPYATDSDLLLAKKLFGATIEMPREELIDIVTAISGSGPAYLFFIFIWIISAAKELGLNKRQANTLVYHTVIGAMKLLKKENFDAQGLISKIASKGGTTEAALNVFKDKKLGEIIKEAVRAAYKRAKELSRG